MKKLIFIMLISIIAVSASAQIPRGFRMGARITGGVSNNSIIDDAATFGYAGGYVIEYNFNPILFVQSGLELENIAYKEYRRVQNALYGQLPLNLGYRHEMGSGTFVFVQAGPNFRVGISGSDVPMEGGTPEKHFDYYRRFDLALGGRVGMEIRRFQISMGGSYGVTKVTDFSGHNMTVNLGVGYMF